MNKKESLELYTQGVEAWNAWAEEMLAQQNELIAIGQWQVHGKNWSQMASVDFFTTHFTTHDKDVNFIDFLFPGDARFTQVNCDKNAYFNGSHFFGAVTFDQTTFHREVTFDKVTFTKHVTFDGVGFHNSARFNDAIFQEGATFARSRFFRDVGFDRARFSKSTRFNQLVISGPAGFSQVRFIKHVGFKATTFEKEAHFDGTIFHKGATFSRARFLDYGGFTCSEFNGNAVFTKAKFDGNAYFKGTRFIRSAKFDEVEFIKNAVFTETRFSCDAKFICAKFRGDAVFVEAVFSGQVMFTRAEFYNNAIFTKAKFTAYAEFTQAVFQSNTKFLGASFEKDSAFVAIRGLSFFTLKNVSFLSVPDFEQAYFAEAPRLDHSYFRALGNEPDITARWRALRRLAIQAHDHQRELTFLAEEIKSSRGVQDQMLPNLLNIFRGKHVWPSGGRYWAGLLYQWFSDFGRSTARPLFSWVLLTTVFAFCFHYLSPHSDDLDSNNSPSIASCSGSDPVTAALYLSVNNGLVISGLGRAEKLAQSYACLYGSSGKDKLAPIMPDAVVFAGIAQTILSTILIFLFLLALRNYFRIK